MYVFFYELGFAAMLFMTAIILIVFGIILLYKKYWLNFTIITLLLISPLLIFYFYDKANNNYSSLQLKKVQVEIENFHEDNGYYPERLEDLIPNYLKEIPKVNIFLWQQNPYYVKEEDSSYVLGFSRGVLEFCSLNKKTNKIYCQD